MSGCTQLFSQLLLLFCLKKRKKKSLLANFPGFHPENVSPVKAKCKWSIHTYIYIYTWGISFFFFLIICFFKIITTNSNSARITSVELYYYSNENFIMRIAKTFPFYFPLLCQHTGSSGSVVFLIMLFFIIVYNFALFVVFFFFLYCEIDIVSFCFYFFAKSPCICVGSNFEHAPTNLEGTQALDKEFAASAPRAI